jgi:hypothetical protein
MGAPVSSLLRFHFTIDFCLLNAFFLAASRWVLSRHPLFIDAASSTPSSQTFYTETMVQAEIKVKFNVRDPY